MSASSSASRSPAVTELLGLLELETLTPDAFRGGHPAYDRKRVFGGQVIAQALVAACRTVAGKPPHSLHAYFLLPGQPDVPIVYRVGRLREGRSFVTRRVDAMQDERTIFTMTCSFHDDEPGLDSFAPMPDVPPPDDTVDGAAYRASILETLPEPVRRYYERERGIELRPVELERYRGTPQPNGRFHMWIRAASALPDDPLLHRCVLAYASDMMLLDTALASHGRSLFEPGFMAASLDHAIWFHRPFRADEWLLYAQDGPNLHGSRGFARGLIYRADGTLVASTVQEGLVRLRRPEG